MDPLMRRGGRVRAGSGVHATVLRELFTNCIECQCCAWIGRSSQKKFWRFYADHNFR